MLREGRMKKISAIKLVIVLICVMLSTNVYADLKIEEYFDGLTPQSHVNKLYPNERKDELKKGILNYDDIEDLIHLYNPEILNNWNSWENNKSSQDIYNDYQDAADILFSSAGNQDSDMQEAMIKAQGTAMQIQADKNASDSYTNFLNNYLVENQLVLNTKILDLNYQKCAYEMLNAEESVKEAERKEDTANSAFQYGSGTQLDLLNAKKSVADAKSALIIAESNQKTHKRNLLINCGKAMSDSIYITPIDLEVGYDVFSIDLANDYQYALVHNIQREIYRRKIENARTEEVKNEFKILYDTSDEKIFNDLEKKYSNILDAADTVNNKLIAYNLANDNLNKAKNEYEHGNISLKEFKTAEYNVVIARNNMQSSKYDLKIAVETYKYAAKGFGDC